jgi:NAD(P)-dependent dehydrogenase (short-subunit alcohol dehydrogenase family)
MAGAYAKDNVRVNCICAGRIDTPRVPAPTASRPPRRRDRPADSSGQVKTYPFWVGKPEDIANIALFLASDESDDYGAAIAADGPLT